MFCDEASIIGEKDGKGVVASLRCKCWDCDTCRSANRERLRSRILALQPSLFVTLTVNPAHGSSPTDRARRLTESFRVVRRRMMHKWGIKKIPFIATFEETGRGEPHLHIVLQSPLRAEVLMRWLSSQMEGLQKAPRVDVRAIHDLAGLAKYLSKNPAKFAGRKRYWSSMHLKIARVTRAAYKALNIVCKSIHWIAQDLANDGFRVNWLNRRRLEFHPPP